jgi:hypothetical protein
MLHTACSAAASLPVVGNKHVQSTPAPASTSQVYNFGVVVARLPEPGALAVPTTPAAAAPASAGAKGEGKGGGKGAGGKAGAGKGKGGGAGSAAAAEPAAAAASGAAETAAVKAPAAPAAPAAPEEPAARANLKFTNPGKVPCTVKFSIQPRDGAAAGQRFPIEVQPAAVTIPPSESRWVRLGWALLVGAAIWTFESLARPAVHSQTWGVNKSSPHQLCSPFLARQTPRRYITLHFTPCAIASYSATFHADVEAGADPRTRGFACELRGEGSLPSLTLQVRGAWLAFSMGFVGAARSEPRPGCSLE